MDDLVVLNVEDACADLVVLEEISEDDNKTKRILDSLIELINAERSAAEQRRARNGAGK